MGRYKCEKCGLDICNCTPEERAGCFWDNSKQRDRRDFLNVKPRQKRRDVTLNHNAWHRGRRGK